jgi:hypothetical protein
MRSWHGRLVALDVAVWLVAVPLLAAAMLGSIVAFSDWPDQMLPAGGDGTLRLARPPRAVANAAHVATPAALRLRARASGPAASARRSAHRPNLSPTGADSRRRRPLPSARGRPTPAVRPAGDSAPRASVPPAVEPSAGEPTHPAPTPAAVAQVERPGVKPPAVRPPTVTVQLPKLALPKVKLPKVELPNVVVKLPSVEVAPIKLPKIDAATVKLPKVAVAPVKLPKVAVAPGQLPTAEAATVELR